MTCTKTGCHIYIWPYQEYAYGDAFEIGPTAYFRLVQRSFTPLFPMIHYTVRDIADWFDQDGSSQRPSTLISHDWVSFGYEGTPATKEPKEKKEQ